MRFARLLIVAVLITACSIVRPAFVPSGNPFDATPPPPAVDVSEPAYR